MHPRTWRITSWWGKLLYVFGALFVAGRSLAWLFGLLGVPALVWVVIAVVFDLAILVIGARIFRGKGEPAAPPRPWWQMTARKKLSRRLGITFVVFTGWLVLWLVLTFVLGRSLHYSIVEIVSDFVYVAVPAFLYLNSAARLKPEPKPDQFTPVVHF